VRDKTGAVIPGAKVTLASQDTSETRGAVADERGAYLMLDGQDINDVGIGGKAFNINIPDAYQSVTALTNSSSAEYGRSGGLP
jgi:hypothetical protein